MAGNRGGRLASRLLEMVQDKLARRFLGAAGVALGLRIAWAVVNYAGVVLLARWLSNDDYGRWAFIISLVTLLSIVCGLGAQTTLLRYLGQYDSQDKPGLARGAVAYATRWVLYASLAVAALGVTAAYAGAAAGWVERPLTFALGLAILPAFTLIDAQSGVARAYRAVVSALAPKDVLWRASLIPLGLAVTVYAVAADQLPLLLAGAALLITLAALAQRAALSRVMPTEVRQAEPETAPGEWRAVARPIWIAAVAVTALNTADILVVGLVLSAEQAGWYFAASRTAALVSFVLVSTNLVVGPEVSRLYHAGQHEALKGLLKIASLVVFVPSLGAFILCAVFGDRILALFGPDFLAVRMELTLLAAGQAVNAATGCIGVVMNMTGQQAKAAQIQVTTAVLTTLAIVAGAAALGTLGAAMAAAGGLTLWNVRMWWHVRTKLGMDPSVLGVLSK